MVTLNKKQAINIIKDSSNFQATIEYIQNSFTMNTKGDSMPKQENKVSLNSIYELMMDMKTETNKRFDSIEAEIKDIKAEMKDMKMRLDLICSLPTIIKELNNLNK